MQTNLRHVPPLDALRGFVSAARRMSISLAAQDLHLTQSAVSRQIQAIEAYLGKPLFVRKHRALELTDTGEQLFHLASPWLNRLVEFTESVKYGERTRPVTITASIGVSSLWLLPRLGKFQEAHPHIDVRVAANNRLVDLKQDGIDLAIRYCRKRDAPTNAIRLFGEEVIPVANKTVAKTAFKDQAALLKHVLLELDERAKPWLRWSDWLHVNGMPHAKPKGYLHFNQYDQVIQAAIEGHGVALGRLALVMPMLKDGRLVAQADVKPGISDFAYWLVQREDATGAEIRLLADWIICEVGSSGIL